MVPFSRTRSAVGSVEQPTRSRARAMHATRRDMTAVDVWQEPGPRYGGPVCDVPTVSRFGGSLSRRTDDGRRAMWRAGFRTSRGLTGTDHINGTCLLLDVYKRLIYSTILPCLTHAHGRFRQLARKQGDPRSARATILSALT